MRTAPPPASGRLGNPRAATGDPLPRVHHTADPSRVDLFTVTNTRKPDRPRM
ncbi:hypothetical protein ACIBCN_01940 [Nocardia sp. NPDC051052]|uniref:hypothetical protein n=1 Tax=Nocardia sp. NPDC051052 TaxID=3364322 RepID=UPI00378846B4